MKKQFIIACLLTSIMQLRSEQDTFSISELLTFLTYAQERKLISSTDVTLLQKDASEITQKIGSNPFWIAEIRHAVKMTKWNFFNALDYKKTLEALQELQPQSIIKKEVVKRRAFSTSDIENHEPLTPSGMLDLHFHFLDEYYEKTNA